MARRKRRSQASARIVAELTAKRQRTPDMLIRTSMSAWPTSGTKQTRQRTLMDPRMWSNLPEDLVERIVACLPLPCLFRFSCVCKQWTANLSCRSFRADCSELQGRHETYHVMLLEKNDEKIGLAYNFHSHKWLRIPFSVLTRPTDFDVVAAAGGLLCLKDRETSALSVSNPLTSSSRTLPPLLSIKSAFEAGMTMEENGIDYCIVVWSDEHPAPITEVYSSRTGMWQIRSSIDIRGDALSECGLVCGSTFYILVIYEYLSVFAYKILEDKWIELQAPMPPDILYGYLLDHWGNLLMVGGIGKDFPTKGISVWKLHKNMVWERILEMPDNLFKKLTRKFKKYDAFKCAGHGDQICFIGDGHPRALMYDIAKELWWWSPEFVTGRHYQIVAMNLLLDVEA